MGMEWLIAKKAFENHKRGERFQAVVDERMANLILAGYVARLEIIKVTPIPRARRYRAGRLANPERIQAKPDGQG